MKKSLISKISVFLIFTTVMGNQPSQQNQTTNRPVRRPPPNQPQVPRKPIQQPQIPIKNPVLNNQNLLNQVAQPMVFVPPPTKMVATIMERPQSTKNIIKGADIMNINQKVEQYRETQRNEEQEFLKNLEKQKTQFYEKQKTMDDTFQEELKEFEMKYNPFRILHLDYSATEDDVKKAYRKFSLKYHPDKPGGNAKKFMMVSQAYVYLMQKIKEMAGNKSHHELRNEAKNYFEEMEQKRQEIRQSTKGNEIEYSSDRMEVGEKNFNVDRFNEIFEKNKMPSQWDRGYGDWGEDDADEQIVFNKKFSLDLFNSTFDEHKKNRVEKKPERQLMVIDEPQPQLLSNLGFEELGQGDINDFTNERVNMGMQFTDYKMAYTKANVLEYDEKFNRGDYKNIDHLVKERTSANFELTHEDKARLQKREMLMKQQEEERIQNMISFDRMAEQYSQRANQYFIKNKK